MIQGKLFTTKNTKNTKDTKDTKDTKKRNCASSQAPAWEFSAGSSSFPKSRELALSELGRPSWSSRRYTHLDVGRNKPVRAKARTGVSGAPIAGNTHPCCRRVGLFRPTSLSALRYSVCVLFTTENTEKIILLTRTIGISVFSVVILGFFLKPNTFTVSSVWEPVHSRLSCLSWTNRRFLK
jgi:hypothetical protein